MASSNRLGISAVLEKAGTAVLDAYSDFSAATSQAASVVILQNLSDADAMLSFDGGTTDHLPIVSNSYFLLDLNRFTVDNQLKLSKGTVFSVKRLVAGTGATTGSVWITVIYATGN